MARNDGWLSHRDLILSIMERKYAKYAEAWKDERDDRVLVSNIYRMLTKGLKELNDDNMTAWIRVAVCNACKEKEAMMDRIIERFANRKED